MRNLVTPTAKRPCLPNEYLVYVDYKMPRDRKRLENEFSLNGVGCLIFDEQYPWHYHPSCLAIDQMPGERDMLVKHFDQSSIDSESAIAKMRQIGYRPATHFEAYAFATANPDLQRQYWIVACGSFVQYGLNNNRYVAVLRTHGADRERAFEVRSCDHPWYRTHRLLFVHEEIHP